MNFPRFHLFAILAAAACCSPVAAQEEAIAEAVPVVTPAEGDSTQPAVEATPAEPVADEAAKESRPASLRPLTVAADLLGETKITGTLVDSTVLQMKTAFGEAQIPLTEIAGVRFPTGEENSTTVVMLNGDSITGATDLKVLTVETEWGTAKINGQSIVSMLFVPGLQWEGANGINGKRWTLTEVRPQTRGSQSAPSSGASGSGPNSSGGAINNGTIQGSPSTQGSPSFLGAPSVAPSSSPFGTLNAPSQPAPQLNIGPRFQ